MSLKTLVPAQIQTDTETVISLYISKQAIYADAGYIFSLILLDFSNQSYVLVLLPVL